MKSGYFFATKESIEKSTKLSPYKQRKSTEILQKASILSVKLIGIPPKTYYKINEENLLKVLKNSVMHEVNNKENMTWITGYVWDEYQYVKKFHTNNNK